MDKHLTTIFLLYACLATALSAKFPSNWTKCPKKDNEACLKELIPKIMADLQNGKKELGMIPVDPLHFLRMELNQGSKSPVNINMTLLDFDLIGATRIKVISAKADWENYEIVLDVKVVDGPGYLIGNYIGKGKIIVLPINGKGKFNITLEDLGVTLKFKGHEETRNGKKYFHADKGNFIIKPRRTYLYFENMVQGVPTLSENVNKFLNENDREVMGDLNETISNSLGEGVKEVVNQMFQRIPLSELYS